MPLATWPRVQHSNSTWVLEILQLLRCSLMQLSWQLEHPKCVVENWEFSVVCTKLKKKPKHPSYTNYFPKTQSMVLLHGLHGLSQCVKQIRAEQKNSDNRTMGFRLQRPASKTYDAWCISFSFSSPTCKWDAGSKRACENRHSPIGIDWINQIGLAPPE